MPDDTTGRDTFADIWSSDGVTRSFAPSATGVPVDLPFLFSGGQAFGPYRIIRPIGKGGMGQVYEAEETESGRRVALKLLSRGLGDDEERERFLREGRLAASLNHPNCVYVFGTSEIQGFPAIAMELVPHGTLKDLVVPAASGVEGPGTPMTAAAAVDAILQVIAGLDVAASVGILHRDVKPSNCFVHRDGRVLVGDFGLSVATAGHGASAGTVLGTPGFASPEQLRGDSLDVRSDIYSVGATLFYLLAGRPPFEDRSTTDLLTKVASQPAPSLRVVRPDLPRRLTLIVARCLAKRPQDRFADYPALSAALTPFSSARLRHAPIVRRAVAGWIDSNLIAIPTVGLVRLLGLEIYSPAHVGHALAGSAIAAAVTAAYYGVLEGQWGAGAGKALFGLRVVDADQVAPGIPAGMRRALTFAAAVQAVLLIVRMVVLRADPEFSARVVDLIGRALYVLLLFSTARRSNGFQALHDRFSVTRVVRRRVRAEVRRRADRALRQPEAPFESTLRVGPYLVPASTAPAVAAATTIEAFDDRLHRRVWIERLPVNTAALGSARRDLDRQGRVRWLGGKRDATECWDAYEAIDGVPIDEAVSTPQPWTRVRHWLADLAQEICAAQEDGTEPLLAPESIWIGADDHARVSEWRREADGIARISEGAADLATTERLLYSVAVAALLGVPVGEAARRQPETPLPLGARTLLLSLRDAKFASAAAMLPAVTAAIAAPAEYARGRRGGQVAASAVFPVLMAIVAVGGIIWVGKNRATMPDAAEAFSLVSVRGFWLVALASGAGSAVVPMFAAAFGALITGSGFTFRPFGAALVNRRGARASRVRALWRWAITWAPICAVLVVIKMSPEPPNYSVAWLTLQTALVALIAAAAVFGVYHPSRSLQDRLSGTWIVPR